MLTQQKILFVHIPKTSGSSITFHLSRKGLDNWKRDLLNFKHHDSLIQLLQNNIIDDKVFKFSVVRNPYTRTYSYYHHFMKINSCSLTLNDFLWIIKRKIHFNETPLIQYPQNFYILNEDGKIGVDKLYRYENLHELEIDLNCKFDKINVGNYKKDSYYKDYTNDNINLVKEIFFDDFKILDYPLEFS